MDALLSDPIYGYTTELPDWEKKKIDDVLLEKITILMKHPSVRTEQNIENIKQHFKNLDFFKRVTQNQTEGERQKKCSIL